MGVFTLYQLNTTPCPQLLEPEWLEPGTKVISRSAKAQALPVEERSSTHTVNLRRKLTSVAGRNSPATEKLRGEQLPYTVNLKGVKNSGRNLPLEQTGEKLAQY